MERTRSKAVSGGLRRRTKKRELMEKLMRVGSKISGMILSLAMAATLLLPSQAEAKKLKVITTLTDLASLTQEVGGDKVEVEALAKGYQDPHFVDPKPSFLLKLRNADVLILVGLDLEIGWLPPLITQSGNGRIQPGSPGYLDASQFAQILEIPQGNVTRAEGDVHPLGNPHYWLDPDNGRRIAKGIAAKLAAMDPEDQAYFQQREQDFEKRLAEADKKWLAQMAPYRGRKVVTYHRSWPNFAKHFNLDVIGYIEPRPGIPPTPSHTVDLVNQMRRENVKIQLIEPYFDLKTPNSIASMANGKVVVLLPSVGGKPEITDYFKLFDEDIDRLKRAFEETK